MLEQIVILSNHSAKRIKERFKLNRAAAQRLAEEIVSTGKKQRTKDTGCLMFEKNGHSYIFVKTTEQKSGEEALLMVTACNDDRCSEWTHFIRGERRKFTAIKRSRINGNAPVNKTRSKIKHKNLLLEIGDSA